MKYFSMFSGIGGFELGIQQAIANHGTTALCVGYSEINRYADQIYQKHFGGKNYGDATKINARQLPDFDLLVGGFPCQAFSIAGKRAGFNDTRGTLFFDIARILKEKRPRHLVLENVKGLLSHEQGKTFQTILGVLADLGYFVEWQVLNSKDFGVPQNRERVFIVGHFGGQPRRKVLPIFGTNQANTYVRTIRAGGSGSATEKHARDLIQVRSAATRTRKYAGKPETLEIRKDNLSNTINSVTKDYYATDGVRIRRLTPVECERLQGFADGHTEGLSDTQRYKTLGNAVTVNVVEAVMTRLLENVIDTCKV